ncbi:hypothetical protein B0H13DRAFT_2343505 [Mycena leptocephala]|nr:hypothetical protein B0H13DRAFT_2343505 [Mycena leptocephala]
MHQEAPSGHVLDMDCAWGAWTKRSVFMNLSESNGRGVCAKEALGGGGHAIEGGDATSATGIGLRAKQAHCHDRLAAFFERKWKLPTNTAARRLVELEQAAEAEDADLEHFFS